MSLPPKSDIADLYPRIGIDGTAIDIEIIFREHSWPFIYCPPRAIKYSAKHVFRHSNLQVVAREFDFSLPHVSTIQQSREDSLTFWTSMPVVPSKT